MNRRAAMECLETRQMLSAVPLEAKIKVAMLTDTNGDALNSSRVTVRFSENITLADASLFRLFGYSINPTSKTGTAQQKTTITMLNVRAGDDGNKIVFETDRRVRKGARIFFYNGAIKNASDSTNIGEQTARLPKGLNKERFTLASRTFEPTQLSYFNKSIFSSAPNVKTTPTQPSGSSVRSALVSFLDKKITLGIIDETDKTSALSRFDDSATASLVPSANLRAAIVSLMGTVGEPAIASLLDGQNQTGKNYTVIDFSATEVSGSAQVAESILNPQTGRLRTLYKSSFQGESFINLSANIAHEALHQDGVEIDGQNEELFANVVETLVYAQQLLVDSTPAKAGTQLATSQNLLLLSMLNSGLALYPRVGLYDAPLLGGQNVFNGGKAIAGGDYTSFENYVRRSYAARNFADNETPANNLALAMQNQICARTDTNNFNFRPSRLEFFDNSQQVITDKAAVQLAAILKLQVQL
jgi:hypothetical protein